MAGLPPASAATGPSLARVIDHTLLKATAAPADIDRLCDEALRYNFWSVCINPLHVRRAVARLHGTGSLVCAVVSFPLGADTPASKLRVARAAVEDGARELDVVADIGALKSRDEKGFLEGIGPLASYAHGAGALLKVILECCYLTDEEKVLGARLAEKAGADFVKTSTGFGSGGATVTDVGLLRGAVSRRVGVKAAGGIGTLAKVQEMLKAGADRIGTSSGVSIMGEVLGQGT